jgi:hypothetical protein
MSDLFDRFLEEHAAIRCTPRTMAEYSRMVERHLLPAVGGLKVESFTNRDGRRGHHALRATPGQANRVLAALSKALSPAMEWGMRPDGLTPCVRVKK